ncbi:DUF6564 domain-containing protein [Treponema vincentii]|uniref:DUF6564 domain-containing protein n=1 Tax=Treponema vincentii TaxID=69710 RepID=UPI003D901976
MLVAIITVAGVSSRFNQDIAEKDKVLKCIYYEKNRDDTLLKHLLDKCCFADRIIIVGGYQYQSLQAYCSKLPKRLYDKLELVYNSHFSDLSSGYSLYLGLEKAFSFGRDVTKVLFAEGDLDVDDLSFNRVAESELNVLTYTFLPIYASTSVVLYKNKDNCYKYTFNSRHGLLKIDEDFSCIFNSGQIWKFTDISKLKIASEKFIKNSRDETNLVLIQNYIDLCIQDDFELVGIQKWTNCNTRHDYKNISIYWEAEK